MLAALLAFEGVLQLASLVVPVIEDRTRPKIPRRIDDARVGHRGNPAYPGIDARGFRNPRALTEASIVALGNSQTYGTGVTPDEAWPAVLAARLARPIYNMALGGYGAVHNRVHLEEALTLSPEVVIFSLYFGNDFHDDFALATKRGELGRAIGAERLAEIHRLEAAAPLQNEMIRLFRRGRAPKSKNALLRWFTSTSRVYGLIRNLVRALEASDETGDALLSREFARAEAALRGEKRAFASAHEDAAWRTILTAPYRFRTLDDSDPRIRAGVDVTKQAVQVMAERVAGAGARFLVLLIPTKESVFHPRVADPAAHVDLEKLAATERRLKIEITAFLAESDIAHLDLLPVLRDAGTQPYFGDGDGHPNAHGQALIAGAVAETLGKNGFWR